MSSSKSFCYLLYRKVESPYYLNDFVIKFGFSHNFDGNKKRCKAFNTAFCDDGLVHLTWNSPFPREDETALLRKLNQMGLLRPHTSGNYSENITLKVKGETTVKEMVAMYEKLVKRVIEMVDKYFDEKDYEGDDRFINDEEEESDYGESEEELEFDEK